MKALSTLLISTLTIGTASAQSWLVGQPVMTQLSEISVFGGGCFPSAQAMLNYPLYPVTGITYYYLVVGHASPGDYTMVPGPANPLLVGDTVHITSATHTVYNTGAFGGLDLQIWAEGTPTVAGQQHICTVNNLWLSNLLLCEEGLTNTVSAGCETQLSTAVNGVASNDIRFLAPMASTGFTLRVLDTDVAQAQVWDMQGRNVATLLSGQRQVDASAFLDGAYILNVLRTNGERATVRFVLVH